MKDKTDWSTRKGTIAHEIHHVVSSNDDEEDDSDELTPTAVHNITRQSLLQNNPESVLVGSYIELKQLSRRKGKRIKKKIMKQPNGEDITLYYFKHDGKTYSYAKDNIYVSRRELESLSRKHRKRIKSTRIDGQRRRKISFRYAEVYQK